MAKRTSTSLLILAVCALLLTGESMFLDTNHGTAPIGEVPNQPEALQVTTASDVRLSGLTAGFTENLGQRGPGAGAFYCEGDPLSVAFGRGWISFVLQGADGHGGNAVRLRFDGANDVMPSGGAPTGGTSSFFLGKDPSQWVSGARHFDEVRYRGLYEGIDLVFRSVGHELKYEFTVAPGTDPSQIQMTFEGATLLELKRSTGVLAIVTEAGTIHDAPPVCYQEEPSGRHFVPSGYAIQGLSVRFWLGRFNPALPLVLDPSIVFCTYIGGSGDDLVGGSSRSMVDATGCVYMTGSTDSKDFPTTPSRVQSVLKGNRDAYVLKLSANGKELIYSTFIGGKEEDGGSSIDLDPLGCAYVTGTTFSSDFPNRGIDGHQGYDDSYNGGGDVFVIKVNATGTYLCYSTYVGGKGKEKGDAIAVDGKGSVFVAASTSGPDFPTTPSAYDRTFNGMLDMAVFELSPDGTALSYSTFIGGSAVDNAQGACLDNVTDEFYITGFTNSSDFPTTDDAVQDTLKGWDDAFVVKLDPLGTKVLFSSYLGGSQIDWGNDIFIYHGLAYITGYTSSDDFPITRNGYDRAHHFAEDAFVVCLHAGVSGLLVSTYLGGSGEDIGLGIFVDDPDRVWVCGWTASPDFPTTGDAYDKLLDADRGDRDGFITRLDVNGSHMGYSTFFGGGSEEWIWGIQVLQGRFVYAVGHTSSYDLPVSAGAFDTTMETARDGFVVELDMGSDRPVLTIAEGPRLYADYKAYDFAVAVRTGRLGETILGVRLVLDAGTESRVVGWDPLRSPHPFYKDPDFGDLVELQSGPGDVLRDEVNGTTLFHFRVMPGWRWPHEDPCDVIVEVVGRDGKATEYPFYDAFSVENDLDLVGGVSVRGEWQGPIIEGGWVRAGENITITGPRVVYEGTNATYPPNGSCSAAVKDDKGRAMALTVLSGQPIEGYFWTDNNTDTFETLSLYLTGLLGKAERRSNRSFDLRLDGKWPTFENPVPEPDDWHGCSDVRVSITVNDTPTSGVDASTLELSYSTDGGASFSAWTAAGVETTGDGRISDGLATVSLPDGAGNRVRWRVKDLVGNGWAVSAPCLVKVDTRNVTFGDAFPDPDRWSTVLEVPCGVVIEDLEGAGIDVSTVQWRVSPTNLSHYGAWTDWDEGAAVDNVTVDVRALITVAESGSNYVQWRAMDIAGNGYTTSPHYRVRADATPIAFAGFEPGEDRFQNATRVTCWVTASDGPASSGVDLSSIGYRVGRGDAATPEWSDWVPVGMAGAAQTTRFSIVLDLAHAPDNLVQLGGTDVAGNPRSVSAVFRIVVDTVAPVFVEVRPGAGEKQPGPEVPVTVWMTDDFTGVDLARVSYRYGPAPRELGEWGTMAVVPQNLGRFSGAVSVPCFPGKENYVQFRAIDLAGNEALSAVLALWVNRPPVAGIASPRDGAAIQPGEVVGLSANGTLDPDGDALAYEWFMDGVPIQGAYGPTASASPGEGRHVILLRVTDDQGSAATDTVEVTVAPWPTPRVDEGMGGGLLYIVVIIIIVAGLGGAAVVRMRSRRGWPPAR